MGATPPIPTGTFDPANVVLSFNGTTIVGFAKGTEIKVSYDTDAYTDDAGANGDVVRVKSNDQRAKIEIELMQSSPSNDALSAFAAADQTGAGKGPVRVKDLNGRSVASGPDAWVQKVADSEYATEHTPRAWIIRVAKLTMTTGGIV